MIFVSWYATIGLAFAFLFLARRSVLPFYTDNILNLLTLNYYTGIAALIVWIIPELFVYVKDNLIKSVVTIGVVIALGIGYWQFTAVHENKLFLKQKLNPNMIQSYYVGLVFDLMGYPPDEHMTTAKDLFDAVNSYRTKMGLRQLHDDIVSCQRATMRVKAIESLTYARQSLTVTKTSDIENGLSEIAYIDEVHEQPITGDHLVSIVWNRPFSQQAGLLSDPKWEGGCASVSGLTTSFIFVTYK